MNVKQNLRYQETHKEIMAALLDLLQTKSVKQVTVSEICRRVHINRSTFYEHFLDVSDVLEKIAVEINKEVDEKSPHGRRPQREDTLRLFEYLKEHQEFFTLYFKQGLPLDIQERFFHRDPPPFDAAGLAALGIVSETQLEYRHAIFIAGVDAMLRLWFERGCAETPEELYDIMLKEFPKQE